MKRKYIKGVVECEGTCGRMLRSSKMPKEKHPGTVKRYSGGFCQVCWEARGEELKTVKEPLPAIRPCAACGHPTRDQKTLAGQAPGTRRRIGDLCRTCDGKGVTVPTEETVAAAQALTGFLAARRKRAEVAARRAAAVQALSRRVAS
ncbi:hypothetical protein [Arthrobacter sp. SD76]|uniref:hypothetical protein n=1 Tax=Arthrobacter sp. SD76 TaxID=3415007 RepID=UPI003C71EB67